MDDESISLNRSLRALERYANEKQACFNSAKPYLDQALNEDIQELGSSGINVKQEFCRRLNEKLRTAGLALKCPATGDPAILRATSVDRKSGKEDRFQFERISDRRRPFSQFQPPDLEVIQRDARRESLAEYWKEKSSESGRSQ